MATNPIFSDVPAWPEATPQSAPPPAGHNRPPLEELIPQEFREALIADQPDFEARVSALVEAAERAVAHDDETLGRCGDLVKAYRKAKQHIDATHKGVKQPYLDGGRLVDAERKARLDPIESAWAKVEEIGNAYVAKRDAAIKAERERIAAEQRAAAEAAAEAERQRVAAEQAAAKALAEASGDDEREAAKAAAAEAARQAEQAQAAAALAPAAPAASSLVRSDAGASISTKQDWMSAVDDHAKAFKMVKNDAKVREAIEAAVQRLVKQTKGQIEIPGARIWPVAKANFR